MKSSLFTNVLKDMIEEKNMPFFGLSASFSEMLNETYKEVHWKNLFAKFN
jgi:hypothetical protein